MPVPAVAMAFAGFATAVTFLASYLGGTYDFAPDACKRLEPYLLSHIVGQELAIHQLCDAVCDHLQNPNPTKPLVISVHGPPGVGKSMSHLLAARALYSRHPNRPLQCPGKDCRGYKVLYGMDYISADRDRQHAYLKASLLDHLRHAPQSLIVIEEYDKLDCPTRAVFKQLIENSHTANVSMDRSVVVLESNTGYTQLHQLLLAAGDRRAVSPEAAQRTLKDLVFSLWLNGACEGRTDTLKMVSLVDFFLPFLPLERAHVERLFAMRLADKAAELQRGYRANLTWAPAVVPFLTDKVDFEGGFPIEGAKEVGTVMTRHVSRLLRSWVNARQAAREQNAAANIRENVSRCAQAGGIDDLLHLNIEQRAGGSTLELVPGRQPCSVQLQR